MNYSSVLNKLRNDIEKDKLQVLITRYLGYLQWYGVIPKYSTHYECFHLQWCKIFGPKLRLESSSVSNSTSNSILDPFDFGVPKSECGEEEREILVKNIKKFEFDT